MVTDKEQGEFNSEDESLLRQLAALASLGLQHIEAREHAERQAAELDVSNKELESFAYSVAHDLRAPLRHIDGFGRMLIEDYASALNDEGKRYLNVMSTASQKMGQLIDDLLNLSRVTRAEIYREPVNLSEVARDVWTEISDEQPERHVEFRVTPDLKADGDARLLRIALAHLLGNAWKFTAKRQEARVEFGVARQDGKNVYYVTDNGAGFDPAHGGKLFGAFQRLHRTDEYPGTGIGLATVQRIVHRHGGRIWAEGSVGQGATFYFTL
jgi:light-regulated signal transduction histidine kinase (bacteriophytochrome)